HASDASKLALRHPSAGVRRIALGVVQRHDPSSPRTILSSQALTDADPRVRLAVYLALAEMPPSPETARRLVQELCGGRIRGDRSLADAATAAAAANATDFLRLMAKAPAGSIRRLSEQAIPIVSRVSEHYARGGPADSVGGLIVALGQAEPKVADAIVTS